jgi:putative peptidoglycan binding protein
VSVMTTDEPARGPDPDDWFDEPATQDVWSARVERVARERQASADDWLSERPGPERSIASRLPRRGLLAVAALLLLLFFGILAAAGVFSGNARRSTPPIPSTPRSTPVATTAPTTTQTTTQPTLPTTTLKPGDHGAAVSRLQQALAQTGYSPGKVDASYGPATTQAVKSFQQAHGLTADGVAGPKTLAALQRALQAG